MYTFYGLPYCDATKLAMEWFKTNRLAFTLHDYKTQGITAEILTRWCNQLGWQTLLNKRSTTWRSLSPQEQENITDQASAIAAMVKYTSLIKRPVIEQNGKVLAVGFNEKTYTSAFNTK